MKTVRCSITQHEIAAQEAVQGRSIRSGLLALIKHDNPTFQDSDFISIDELNRYRKKYLEVLLKDELGELSVLEKDVLKSITQNELMATNIEPDIKKDLTLGERVADQIAMFGGSWTFIIFFFSFIFGWMVTNIYLLVNKPFDPFPFILLNLILSCLAAIQAPIIMMSQNRQEAKDRKRSEHDYKINLKAELEIRLLHEKIDHLLMQQSQRMLEIQQLQVDLMEDILERLNPSNKA